MRICTWNILLGLRLGAVINAVRKRPDFHALDLFALQEASVHEGRPDAEAIAEVMGDGYSWFQATAQMIRGREQANALIWKRGAFEPESLEVVTLAPMDEMRLTRVERAMLRAVPPQTRIAVRAESRDLRVYVMHLDVVGFAHKLEQFRSVINDMKARPEVGRTLLAGDMNTFGPPGLHPWRRLREAAHEAGLTEVTQHLRRTHWTVQKLDAIYVGGEPAHRPHAWTLRLRASDHFPVFADI